MTHSTRIRLELGTLAVIVALLVYLHFGPSKSVKELAKRFKEVAAQNTILHQHNALLDAANTKRQERIDSLAGRNTVLLAQSKTYRDSTKKLEQALDDAGIPTSPTDPKWMVRSIHQDTIIARKDTTINTLTSVIVNDTAQMDIFRKMYKADSAFKDSVLTHADTTLHLAHDAIAVADCKFLHFFHCPSRKEAFVAGAGTTVITAVVLKSAYDLFIKPRLAKN